jgi:hypothetical protein
MAASDRGPLLFARYAYGPNALGYCGPDAADELFGEATSGRADAAALRALAGQFEGAFPYLRLIAEANGLADPLEARVVEAYWLGNELLERVSPRRLGDSLDLRFRRRLGGDGWRWLADKPAAGAQPVHAFHVLDVFPRLGLLRSGEAERVLETIDACRISWGTVLERDGDWLSVGAVPLVMTQGKLALGAARARRARVSRNGAGFVDSVRVGDVVSLHWDWACERLSPTRLASLQRSTNHQLTIANQTI